MEQNNLTVREIMNLTGIPNMEGTVVMFDYTTTTTDTTSTINNITSNNTKTFVVIGMIERYDVDSLYMRAAIYNSIYSFNCNNFSEFNVGPFYLENISNFKVADKNDIGIYMRAFKMYVTALSEKTDKFIRNHSAIQQIMDIINDGNIDKDYVIEYLKD